MAQKFKRHEQLTGRPPVILAMNETHLTGYIPGHELGFADKNEHIEGYIKHMPAISYAASHRDVVHKFHAHPHSKVATDVLGFLSFLSLGTIILG